MGNHPIPQAGHGSLFAGFESSDCVARSVRFFLMSSLSHEVVTADTAVTETPKVIACSKDEDSFMGLNFFQKLSLKSKTNKFIIRSVVFFEQTSSIAPLFKTIYLIIF